MGAKKWLDEDEVSHAPLQAVLLADSIASNFHPMTLQCPKVLLPLVNVPMINYTLEWLQSEEVQELFILCSARSKQLINYLKSSKWLTQPNFFVKIITTKTAFSIGDALRVIRNENVIHEDFVLVNGATVSNMPLGNVIKEHRDRLEKDSNVLMTMVIQQSKPSPVTHQSRFGTDEVFMAIDPSTSQLVYYEEDATGFISLDKDLLPYNPSLSISNDKMVCCIDICSKKVLELFHENFDYQHLRPDFVRDSLFDNIMSYKIFTYEIHSSYAARVDNFRSYDTISKDIIQRLTYPLVPDVQFCGNSATKFEGHGIYRGSDVHQSRSAQVGPFTVIGNGTTIGNNSKISNSVVGENCTIGSNVYIYGCYIWNNVTIKDGCQLKNAIVCHGVVLESKSLLEPGVVLSFEVSIAQNFVVPAYSKVSLLPQPTNELEFADIADSPSSDTPDMLSEDFQVELMDSQLRTASEVGSGGVGFIWSIPEGRLEGEWRHSVAPIPQEKLSEIIQRTSDELYIDQDGSINPSGELESGSVSDDSGDIVDINEFEKEVEATFLRAVHDNIEEETVMFELNNLRLPLLLHAEDCASALFYSMMKFALDAPHSSHEELLRNASNVINQWKNLLKKFMKKIDHQIEVLLKFEEMCSESTKEYSYVFEQMLHLLYDNDIVEEDAILRWAFEKEGADENDKVYVKKSESFIKWLKEAPEEEDEDDEE